MASSRKHIVIAPFYGFGCLLPAIEVARKLANSLCRVTIIVSSTTNKNGFQQKVLDLNGANLLDNIVSKIPSTRSNSATPLMDASRASSPAMAKQLRFMDNVTTNRLEIGDCLETLIQEGVDAVISECLWGGDIVELAMRQSVPAYYFCSTSMADLLIMGAITPNTVRSDPMKGSLFTELPLRGKSLARVPFMFQEVFLSAQRGLQFVKGIVINSVREVDSKLVPLLEFYPLLKHVPLWFVGPLLAGDDGIRESKQAPIVTEVQAWLNKKAERSVTYVSFGSHCAPRPSQTEEIFRALKHLDKPVICSLNPLCFKDLTSDIAVAQAGSVNANANKELLVLGWAPQTTILAHPAVAVFVSHCGWNSTLEAMTYGVPVVAWPFTSDQQRNGQLLADLGMAIPLPDVSNHDDSRVVCSEELVNAVNTVAGWTGAKSYWEAAGKWKAIMESARRPGGSSYQESHDFLASICL